MIQCLSTSYYMGILFYTFPICRYFEFILVIILDIFFYIDGLFKNSFLRYFNSFRLFLFVYFFCFFSMFFLSLVKNVMHSYRTINNNFNGYVTVIFTPNSSDDLFCCLYPSSMLMSYNCMARKGVSFREIFSRVADPEVYM